MFDRDKVLLGITPTGWTNDDMPGLGEYIPFEQCVSEMALAGFEGCSVGHKFPKDTKVLKEELELRGLRVSEPWASTFFTANEMERQTYELFDRQMRFIKEMGGTDIVLAELGQAVHQQPVAVLPNKPVFTEEQWDAMIRALYATRIDTGHLYWAGDDPLDMARAYADRIKHVHLKDIRQEILEESTRLGRSFLESVVAGVFTVPGDGVIDFEPILQVLADHNYEGWLIVEAEQDAAKADPLRYAKKARAYLREVIGF